MRLTHQWARTRPAGLNLLSEIDRKLSSTLTVCIYSYVKACLMSITVLGPMAEGGTQVPFYSFRVPAGFPSPAADHLEQHISIDELLDIRAPHIYLVRIEGRSMEGAGIFDGDMAVVDRSITAEHGHIVIAAVNCEPVCKRLCKRGPNIILISENPGYPPRYILEGDELIIWGVVTFSVRAHDPKA